MSNDINYDLRFRSDKRSTLTQVKDYLTEKKRQWDGRGSKTAKDLLKEAGLKHPAEVVTWGFEFGSIRKQADGTYSADVSSWANENSLGNVWISGDKGELKFLLDRFPGLTIDGEFDGEEMSGIVRGYQLIEREPDKPRERLKIQLRSDGKKFSKKVTAALFKAIQDDDYYDYLTDGLSAAFFEKFLQDGADPNGCSRGVSLFEQLMRNAAMFGYGDQNYVETRKTLELLLAHGMRLKQAGHLAELLVWVPGLPDQVREFAKKQKLLRATEEETRFEVLRVRLAKGGLRVIPDDFFKLAGPLAQKDRNFVELALKENGGTLSCACEAVRSDKNLVLVAVSSRFGNAIRYASATLRDDPDVALAAVSNTKEALEYVSERLRNDPRVVLAAVHKDGTVLEHASKRLRSDPSVVRAAVASDGTALEFAATALKNNKDIVKEAVKTSGSYAFEHASKALQRDPEIRKIHENHEYYFPE
jgi:hypothetical protein